MNCGDALSAARQQTSKRNSGEIFGRNAQTWIVAGQTAFFTKPKKKPSPHGTGGFLIKWRAKMETREYTTIDRSGWPSGEWDGEPDKVQWQDEETGLPCLAVRNRYGAWCGYVGVSAGHPWYEKKYSDVDADCHGGPTFANFCQPHESEAEGICHVPGTGEPDRVWWIGFDCVHGMDWSPRDAAMELKEGYPFTRIPGQKYRTLQYVKNECRSLASQAIDAEQSCTLHSEGDDNSLADKE